MDWVKVFGPGVMEHLSAILIATVIIALVGWAVTALGWVWSAIREKREREKLRRDADRTTQEQIRRARAEVKKEFRQRYEAALPRLARNLAGMILEPVIYEDVEKRGRAIVSTRNEMRQTMTNLHYLLNDQIDELQKIIRATGEDTRDRREAMMRTIRTLQITWKDGKIERIEIELRKLLAENGLSEILVDEPA